MLIKNHLSKKKLEKLYNSKKMNQKEIIEMIQKEIQRLKEIEGYG